MAHCGLCARHSLRYVFAAGSFARPRRLRPRRAIPFRARPAHASDRLRTPSADFPPSENRPTPVLQLKRRRRIERGDHSPLPCEAALGQLPGRSIVKAVVRLLAHSDQVPTAPLPAGEIVNRVNVVNCGRHLVTPITAGLSASVAVAPQDRVPQAQPAFAFVIHRQIKKRHDLTRRSWRSCRPAITSGAEQKRQ